MAEPDAAAPTPAAPAATQARGAKPANAPANAPAVGGAAGASRLPLRETSKQESLAEPSQAQLAKAANAKAERGEMRQAALAHARLNVEASQASLEVFEAEVDAEDAAVA